MPSLWFVVPVHGRLELARMCLRQLRHTCDELQHAGIDASAVVITDKETHEQLPDLGFGWVPRDNEFLSCRFNDGIQFACDPEHNPRPVDYVVPCGSDDWVDWRLFTDLPPPNTIYAFQRMAFVREDGLELSVRHLRNEGGCGIRIYPRQVVRALGYRPADEHRTRGCDTSILHNLKRAEAFRAVEHRDIDPLQIVDWKSPGENLNPYEDIAARHRPELVRDPFDVLEGRYPQAALNEMRAHYGLVREAVCV